MNLEKSSFIFIFVYVKEFAGFHTEVIKFMAKTKLLNHCDNKYIATQKIKALEISKREPSVSSINTHYSELTEFAET